MAEADVRVGGVRVTFHRTVRVPSKRGDGTPNQLPASLGSFGLYPVTSLKQAPKHWKREGAYVLPMHGHEAMWLGFAPPAKPRAMVIGTGMVNAVTGDTLSNELSGDKQNYVVVPPQPWIDGFKLKGKEEVRQFVAAVMGDGETAEEQLTGKAEFGGIQLGVFEPKIELIPVHMPGAVGGAGWMANEAAYKASSGILRTCSFNASTTPTMSSARGMSSGPPRETKTSGGIIGASAADAPIGIYNVTDVSEMGLGGGGTIAQKIYDDPYLDGKTVAEVWSAQPTDKAWIYIVHAKDWELLTGNKAPASPITYQTYQEHGYPWFGLADGTWADEGGSDAFEQMAGVGGNPSAVHVEPQPNPDTKGVW